MKMARSTRDTNYFTSDDKYYRQARSEAMGSAFTSVLTSIYVLELEEELIEYEREKNQIYDR